MCVPPESYGEIFQAVSLLSRNVKDRHKGPFPGKKNLVHPDGAYANTSVVSPQQCGSEGEICPLEDENRISSNIWVTREWRAIERR